MLFRSSNATKEARSREAIAVGRELSQAYRENLVGTMAPVLFEEREGGYYTGHTPNYVKVYVEGAELHNQIRLVELTALHEEGMFGVLKEE